jgi:hypothetical protein
VSDDTQRKHGAVAHIDGPAVRRPVTPQVRSENLRELAPRHTALQWRPQDPVTIIDDMKERLQSGNGKANPR